MWDTFFRALIIVYLTRNVSFNAVSVITGHKALFGTYSVEEMPWNESLPFNNIYL